MRGVHGRDWHECIFRLFLKLQYIVNVSKVWISFERWNLSNNLMENEQVSVSFIQSHLESNVSLYIPKIIVRSQLNAKLRMLLRSSVILNEPPWLEQRCKFRTYIFFHTNRPNRSWKSWVDYFYYSVMEKLGFRNFEREKLIHGLDYELCYNFGNSRVAVNLCIVEDKYFVRSWMEYAVVLECGFLVETIRVRRFWR